MDFSYIDDEQWNELNAGTQQTIIQRAFTRDIESAPEWNKLDEASKQKARENYTQKAGTYSEERAPHANGILGAVTGGAKQAMGSVRTAWNVVTNDDEEAREITQDSSKILKTREQQDFSQALQKRKEQGGDDSVWQGIKNVAGAAYDEPLGALHEVATQLPNSGVAMTAMWAGSKAGAMAGAATPLPGGTAVGAIVGGIMGMYFGNTALETGGIAQEQINAGEYDRGDVLEKGAKKGVVITGADIVGMGATKLLFSPVYKATGKAVQAATEKVFKANGINPFDDAAVKIAMQDKTIVAAVRQATTKAAAEAAPKGIKSLGLHGTALGIDMLAEGSGEYGGSKYAGIDASLTDAVMEALMSIPQSMGEVAVGKSLAGGKGILAKAINPQATVDPAQDISNAQSVEEATQAFTDTINKVLDPMQAGLLDQAGIEKDFTTDPVFERTYTDPTVNTPVMPVNQPNMASGYVPQGPSGEITPNPITRPVNKPDMTSGYVPPVDMNLPDTESGYTPVVSAGSVTPKPIIRPRNMPDMESGYQAAATPLNLPSTESGYVSPDPSVKPIKRPFNLPNIDQGTKAPEAPINPVKVPQAIEDDPLIIGESESFVHDHTSTQINIPGKEAEGIRQFAGKIPEKEIYTEPGDNSYGRESTPHVTVKYGLKTNDPGDVSPLVENYPPIKVKMGKVSIFENEKYDVVKVEIDSPELHALNERIEQGADISLPAGEKFDYSPHATIAYVKPGEGQKYVGDNTFEGKEITLDEITVSTRDGKQHQIKLNGKGDNFSGPDDSQNVTEKVSDKNLYPDKAEKAEKTDDPKDSEKNAIAPFEPGQAVTWKTKKGIPQAGTIIKKHAKFGWQIQKDGGQKTYVHEKDLAVQDDTAIPENENREKEKPFTGLMDLLEDQKKEKKARAEENQDLDLQSAVWAIQDGIIDGGFKNITEARKAVSDALHIPMIKGGTIEAKQVDEAIEVAVVKMARTKVSSDRARKVSTQDAYRADDAPKIFDELVDIQDKMPNLSTRTSTSVMNQAYSTPLPLAWVASVRAGVTENQTVYEPSAGNGALLIGSDYSNATANEMDPNRARNLKGIAHTVTENDGTIHNLDKKVDIVIGNPPFGIVKGDDGKTKNWQITDQYSTSQIDHAMVFKALESMKDDGRAVFIIGSVNDRNSSADARKLLYRNPDKVRFYKTLFEQYNVTDIFTMAGDMYKKQGAGWPVDIIVIEGKGKSSMVLPGAVPPRYIDSIQQLKEQLNAPIIKNVDTASGNGRSKDDNSDMVHPGDGDHQEGTPGAIDGTGSENDRRGGGSYAGSGNADGSHGGHESGTIRPDDQEPGNSGVRSDTRESDVSGLSEYSDPGGIPSESDQGQPGSPGDNSRGQTGLESLDGESNSSIEKKDYGSKNKLFTKSAAEKARDLLKQKFSGNQLNSGLDPEIMQAGIQLAGYHIEAGARSFVEFSKAMIADIGETIKPYLRSWYEGVRYYPGFNAEGMTDPQSINEDQAAQKETAPPKKTPEKKPSKQEKPTSTNSQVAYTPSSKSSAIGTLTPVNMAKASERALAKIEKKHGSIDTFVAKELGYTLEEINGTPGKFGYFSGEQVDAIALAIDNISSGAGFIIGDQTGVGKGRVVAAMQRYAMKKGLIPIFVTEKPNLYADMYRDFADIGMADIADKILITNDNETIPLTKTKAIKTKTGHNQVLNKIAAEGVLPKKYKTIFTTYAQLNNTGTPRRRFISEMVRRGGMLIMDESHNAGGSEGTKVTATKYPRSIYFRDLVRDAHSVFYSSATYAKRPGVMDLYAKTDMRLAVDDVRKIGAAILKGGVPLQQAVASMLVEAGQYVRRERSFEGVEYSPKAVEIDKVAAEKIADSLSGIKEFSDFFAEPAIDVIADGEAASGNAVGGLSSAADSNVQSVGFSAIMHNLIDQMLLSMKTEGAVQEAIAAHKAGRKPVITVANTMGSFIKQYAEDNSLKPNDGIGLRFNDLIDSYLEKTRKYTIKDPMNGKPVTYYISDAELGEAGVKAFKSLKKKIMGLELGNLPVSPVDYITHRLEAEGIKTSEITGRSDIIEYRTDGTDRYSKRPATAKSIKGRLEVINGFNEDTIDALILNVSGATGLSLHAIPKWEGHDPKQRHMIILQAEKNIDTHMQMLGRVHRAGQVNNPMYTQLMGDIPSEKRPAAVLASKMASLNANTTAAKDSELSAKETVDFMNKYGDKTAAGLMADFPELHSRLGHPLGTDSKTESGYSEAGAARKITGRIPLLPLAEQEQLYAMLEGNYQDLIEQLNATGENDLEAKTFDTDARVLGQTTVFDKTGVKGDSPFTGAAVAKRVDMKKLGKSYSQAEVLALLTEFNFDMKSTEAGKAEKSLDEILEKGQANHKAQDKEAMDRFSAYQMDAVDNISDENRAAATRQRLEGIREDWAYIHGITQPGNLVDVRVMDDYHKMTVLKVHQTGNPKNPLAMGTWKVTFAVPDSMRRVTYPFSYLINMNPTAPAPSRATYAGELDSRWLRMFDHATKAARETRIIISGNLLAAYGRYEKGRIINYTLEGGGVEQGVLMPADFNLEQAEQERPVFLNNTKDIMTVIERGVNLKGAKGDIKIFPGVVDEWDNKFSAPREFEAPTHIQISVPASKAGGSKYYLNRDLLKTIGRDFIKAGNQMVVNMPIQKAKKAIDVLINRMDEPFYNANRSGAVRDALNIPDITLDGKPQFSTTEDTEKGIEDYDQQTPGQGVSLKDIQARFKGQNIFLSPDGSISISMKNGQGLKIENVKQISDGDVQFAIKTGRMSEKGFILGKYQNKTVTLNEDLASLFTRDHETFHFLEDAGMINDGDRMALDKEFTRLQLEPSTLKDGKKAKEENRANAFAQILENREEYRGTPLGRLIQKITDFLDAILYIGRQSATKLAREVESGKVFGRDAKGRFTNEPMLSTSEDMATPEEKHTAYSQILAGLKNVFTNRKNKGPGYKEDIGVIENFMGLMSHYSEKIPVLAKTFDELLKRPEWKFQKENELSKNGKESLVGVLSDLQKENEVAYTTLKKYLNIRDINQAGNLVVQHIETGDIPFDLDGDKSRKPEVTWKVLSEKNEQTKKRKILQSGFKTKQEAREWSIDHEVSTYPGKEGRAALKAFRTMTANLHDYYAESWEGIVKEYEERGLALPEVVVETKTGESRIDLKVALAKMGERSSYYFPRQRSNGKWKVTATKKGEAAIIDYRDYKTTADYYGGTLKSQGYEIKVEKIGTMSEDVYSNVKNILSTQAMVNQALAETKMDKKERDLKSEFGLNGVWEGADYVVKNGGQYEWSAAVLKELGGEEYSQWGKGMSSWAPGIRFTDAAKDMHEIATNALFAARGIETDVSFQIAQSLANQLADDMRSRGSRARMISRSDAIGQDVPQGYETDPAKAIAQAVNSAAGGYAKQQVALNTSKAISGQHFSWKEYQEQHPDYDALKDAEKEKKALADNTPEEKSRLAAIDQEIKELQREKAGVKTESETSKQDRLYRIGALYREQEIIQKWKDQPRAIALHKIICRYRGAMHKEYRQFIQNNMIDSKKQARAYGDALNAVENVLRNKEASDRVIDTLRGLASVWFLGGRISSAVINMTSLGTTVPACMKVYGNIPMRKVAKHLGKAGKAYAAFATGKGKMSEADRDILNEIDSRGWLAAQLNMETVNALKSGPAKKYGRAVELLMTPFKLTEEFNRATTLLAAYNGIMQATPGLDRESALLKAKKVSDRAHGIYGIENQPALLRKGRGLNAASSMYIFQTFIHNYFTTMAYMIGNKQAKAATYMLLSPAIFGGIGGSVLLQAVKMIFKAMGEDDPEEKIYQIAEQLFGETGGDIARYGLPGLAGVSLKGSLAPNLPDFESPIDVLGPIGGMMRNIYQGGENITQGDFVKGAEKMAPLFIGNGIKGIRETTQGITTRAGDPVFFGSEPIKGDIVSGTMRAFGLNPTKISKPREIQWNETLLAQSYAERKQQLYHKIVRYQTQPGKEKNPQDWEDIVSDIKKFNARVIGNDLTRLVTPITAKTIKARIKRSFRPKKSERLRKDVA